MLQRLFTKIYALSYLEIIFAGSLFSLSILWLRRQHRRLLPLWGGMLLVWAAAVLYLTVWSRSGSGSYRTEWIPFHSYREVLAAGNREILRSNFMNLVLFYPAGLLLAALLPKRWRGWRLPALIVTFAIFSFGIEYAQYHWALGRPEIDDVIHNTLGAVLGAFPAIFWIP